MATIKLDFHNHPLTLVQPAPEEEEKEDASSGNSEKCSICEKGLIKTSSFFQCMETECNLRFTRGGMITKMGKSTSATIANKKEALMISVTILKQAAVLSMFIVCCSLTRLTMLEKESSLGHSLGERNLSKSKYVLVSNEKVVSLAIKKLDELEVVMAVLRTKVKAGTTKIEALKTKLKAVEDKRDATSSTRVKGRS